MLPWARKIPPSPLRDLAPSANFDLLVAGAFTMFAMLFTQPAQWREIARANIVSANRTGFTIHECRGPAGARASLPADVSGASPIDPRSPALPGVARRNAKADNDAE